MRRGKGSRRIVVRGAEYRWRATGDDGSIVVGIWPVNNIGPYIHGNFKYHETWVETGDGSWSSAKDQILITARIVRRMVEYAIAEHHYDPHVKGAELNLRILDDVIPWDDAIRASHNDE